MKLVFRVLNSQLKGLTFDTDKNAVSIGRSSDNDLVLRQDSISRRHALITQDEHTVRLEDMGSKNATEVDGEAVDGVAELEDGSILTFGDVAVQLTIRNGTGVAEGDETPENALIPPREETGGTDSENAPSRYSAVTGPTGGAVAPAAAGAIRERTPQTELSQFEGRVWGLLAAVLGITAAVVAGFFFLNYTGVADRPVDSIGTSLRVGEVKIVEVPTGFVHDPQISPPDIVRVSRALNLNRAVTVEANSQGMASVVLKNTGGQRIVLHVNVLPRTGGPAASQRPMTGPEREAHARERMILAESLRLNGRLYEAKKLYEEVADMVFSPGSQAAVLQQNALRKHAELTAQIDEKYENLYFEASAFVQLGQVRPALRRLEDIMELISDDNDLRHQNAMLLHRMLSSIMERSRR